MIQHRILKQQNYAYIEIRQAPPLAEFIGAARLLVSDKGYSPRLHRICDFTQARLDHITLNDLRRFGEFAASSIPMKRSSRIAIVAPDHLRSGIFKSFAGMIERGQFKIFSNPAEAVDWVQERPEYRKEDGSFCKVLGGVA